MFLVALPAFSLKAPAFGSARWFGRLAKFRLLGSAADKRRQAFNCIRAITLLGAEPLRKNYQFAGGRNTPTSKLYKAHPHLLGQ